MSKCVLCGNNVPNVPLDWIAFCEDHLYVIDDMTSQRWRDNEYGPFYADYTGKKDVHGALRIGLGQVELPCLNEAG